MVVSETDNLRQRRFTAMAGLDAANFAQSSGGPFRFYHQPDQLDYPATNLGYACFPHSLQGAFQAAGPAWQGGFHEATLCANCSSFTSRRASMIPNRV